jgi:hypothetical protein
MGPVHLISIRREAKDIIDSGKMTLDGLTVGQINAVFNNTPKLRQSFLIDSDKMTLDGLTVGQINSVFNNTPKLRQSFQKILNIMSG